MRNVEAIKQWDEFRTAIKASAERKNSKSPTLGEILYFHEKGKYPNRLYVLMKRIEAEIMWRTLLTPKEWVGMFLSASLTAALVVLLIQGLAVVLRAISILPCAAISY